MSRYFWFECLSHDPPLRSPAEISQHDDEFVVAAVRLAQHLPPTPGTGRAFLGEWTRSSIETFLTEHEACALGLVDETGQRRPIPGRSLPRDRAAIEARLTAGQDARAAAERARTAADDQITVATFALAAYDAQEGDR